MQAIVVNGVNDIQLKEVPTPTKASPQHLLLKMEASAINSGDKLFIGGAFPRGIPGSKDNIAGVSGVGKVIETGAEVPAYYKDKYVTVYRSLRSSPETIGTWSEYAHLHYLNAAVLPPVDDVTAYSGSLVNIITPYAFLKQAQQEGHQAIICTAGNSATGIAMLGLCAMHNYPLISIVRNEKGKAELTALGAKHICVQSDAGFKQQLQQVAEELNATVVFDGVGGTTLSSIMDIVPFNTIVYAYGFLDKGNPLSFPTTLLMRGITIKGFSNFRTPTVQDPAELEKAFLDISSFIDKPYFRTKLSHRFSFAEANEALKFSSPGVGKAFFII